jgi:hypothetical protein
MGSLSFSSPGQPFDVVRIAIVPQGSGASSFFVDNITVTPAVAAPRVSAVGASPSSGSGATGIFTFTFSDSSGYQNLSVANVLINNVLDGRSACYIAFVPSGAGGPSVSGSVFLVDDAGNAGGPYTGFSLPGTGTAANGQCTITGAGSSAAGSGNNLTLTLAIAFAPGFAGNRVIYTAAGDASANSGWQAVGAWNIPGNAPAGPWVTGVTPGRSTALAPTYSFTFTDTLGFQDISVANVLIASAIDGRRACYVAVVPSGASSGSVYLVNDAGDAGGPFAGGFVLPGTGTAANSQCSIGAAGVSIAGGGNTLTLTLPVTFSPGFAGNRIVFAAARNNSGGNSGWQAVGTSTVPF